METGTYTGNGTSQSVTIGWQPAFVMVYSSKSGGNPAQRGGAFKTSNMASDNALGVAGACSYNSSHVTLTSSGFSVGSVDQVNRNGESYHYFAVRAGPTFDSGGYTGSTPTPQAIALGRQPTGVFLFDQGTPMVGVKPSIVAAGNFWNFGTNVTFETGVALSSTGFTVSGATANAVEAYSYASFYGLVGANRHWESGSYTGNGATTQAIALGRQPKFLYIRAADTNEGVFKTDTMSGDAAGSITSSANYVTGRASLTATGFQVATDINVTAVTYQWLAGFF